MIPAAVNKPGNILTADNPRTRKPNLPGRPSPLCSKQVYPGKSLIPFRQKSGSFRAAIAVFASEDLPHKTCSLFLRSCGGKSSASIRVCRASRASGRFIKKNAIILFSFAFFPIPNSFLYAPCAMPFLSATHN